MLTDERASGLTGVFSVSSFMQSTLFRCCRGCKSGKEPASLAQYRLEGVTPPGSRARS